MGPLAMFKRNIWIVDVNAGKKKLLYRSKSGNLRGIEWGQDGNHIYTIETVDKGRYSIYQVVRINLRSKSINVLKKSKKPISFFMPPATGFEYLGKNINEPYKVLIGTPKGFWLVDPDSGAGKKILNYSARGCDNSEFDPQGKHIALYFTGLRIPGDIVVTGLYIYDPDAGKEFILYPTYGVHTMWWRPTVEGETQLMTFTTKKTIYGYQYQEATESTAGAYNCVFQIWCGTAPCLPIGSCQYK